MHTALEEGTLGRYAFLLESPESVSVLAPFLEDAREIAYHREYRSVTGLLEGETVTVTSTGMGGPSTDIAVEELHKCGADTMIFVGSGYPVSSMMKPGEAVIVNGAVRMEGVSTHYLPIEYPAAPDYQITKQLKISSEELGIRHYMGISVTTASLYSFLAPEKKPISSEIGSRMEAYRKGGVLTIDMESSVLFTVASTLGLRMGCVLACSDAEKKDGQVPSDYQDYVSAVRIVINAMKRIIQRDRETA